MMLVLVGRVRNIRIVAVKTRKDILIIKLATRKNLSSQFFLMFLIEKMRGGANVILTQNA